MANPVWPTTLPIIVYPAPGDYQRAPQNQALRTPMDAGLAKMRRRYSAKSSLISFKLELTSTQVGELEYFYYTVLQVVNQFDWIDHFTKGVATYRFIAPPTYSSLAMDYWSCSLSLELTP